MKLGHAQGGAFVQNVLKLTLGTGMGQVITLLAAPVIARQYGPAAFGEQSALLSVAGLMSILTSLSFPIGIVVAQDEREAVALRSLALWGSLALSPVLIGILIFNDGWLLHTVGMGILAPYALTLYILTVLITANSSASYVLTRSSAFELSAKSTVASSLLSNGLKIILGSAAPGTSSLILANSLGYLVAPLTALRYCQSGRVEWCSISPAELKLIAIRYRDFAYWRTPQNFINAVSQSLPVITLTAAHGAAVAGQYAVALVVISAPVSLIGNSILSAFYPRINNAVKNEEGIAQLIKKSTLATMALALPPFLVVGLFGPPIFQMVLGGEWADAGNFASILAIWVWLGLANKPVVAAIPALGLQRELLIYELASTGSKIAVLFIGTTIFKDPFTAIGLFAGVGAVAYALLIIWVIMVSAQSEKG